jgi:hypothetical protein
VIVHTRTRQRRRQLGVPQQAAPPPSEQPCGDAALVRWCVGAASRLVVAFRRAELVQKFGGGAVNLQVTAWAASFWKSVG